jgi:hypothetical protein
MFRTSLRTVAAVAALALAALACSGTDPAQQPAEGGAAPSGDPANEPDTGHIHGLGIDPADSTLYIAAHHGVFKVVSGTRAERVAGRFQDTMGFTITGPVRSSPADTRPRTPQGHRTSVLSAPPMPGSPGAWS